MPAYNFWAQFADLVASLRKRQTIRAVGKRRHARPGERVQLYTGMRGPSCRKLVVPDPVCTEVSPVFIGSTGMNEHTRELVVAGRLLVGDELERFAHADGFPDSVSMFDFFQRTHGLPFEGLIIKWEDIRADA